MPKIPTTVSTASILGAGQRSSSAPAGAFGNDGVASLAQGFNDLAVGILQNKEARKEFEAKAKEKEDRKWLNQSLSEYQRRLTDFEVNPENRSKVDFLPNFLKYADEAAQEIMGRAPSSEAHEAFLEKQTSIVDSRYERSASVSASNSIRDDEMMLGDSWSSITSSYHKMAQVDPEAAANDLLSGLDETTGAIFDLYNDIAPETSKRLIYQKIEEAVFALSEKNPTRAKALIEANAFYIPEDRRKILMGVIEEKVEQGSLLLREDFNIYRERSLNNAIKHGTFEEVPLKDYQSVFPGEKAEVVKREDDMKKAAYVDSHEFLKSLQGLRPDAQLQKAEEYYEKEKLYELNITDAAFKEVVIQEIFEQGKQYANDPTEWLRKNHSSVKILEKEVELVESTSAGVTTEEGLYGVLPPLDPSELPEPVSAEEKALARTRYYESILRYQGNPGPDDNPDHFMSLPPNKRHLLTKQQAESYANTINSAEVDTVMGVIKSIIDEYPTEELQYQVLHDLATLPSQKINPVFQLAFENHDQTWLPKFIANVRNIETLEKVNEVDKKKVSAALSSNAIWASYSSAMNTPEDGRIDQIKGFRDAIDIHARAMVAQGMKPREAVDEAVKQLLLSTAVPTEIPVAATQVSYEKNGKTVRPGTFIDRSFWLDRPQIWIPKKPKGFSKTLTPEQIQNYGRRMGTALANIHPDDVDPEQFANIKGVNDKTRKELIHKHIILTGQYYPEPGGAEYIVTIEGETKGTRTALRNKDGSFFTLPLRNVPAYAKKSLRPAGIKIEGILPEDWSWNQTDVDVDYPVDDVGEDGFPKTGSFWKFKK